MPPVPSNVGAAIYGLITVSVLLAAEGIKGETYGETVAGVALALILYWLAHGYSEFAARRLREGERGTLAGLAHTMVDEFPIFLGALLPLLVVVITWAAGVAFKTGINAALWTTVATIVAIEIVAGLRAELTGRELVIQALVGTALGLLVLALRRALH